MEEINLKELILVLWKGKKWVLLATLACMAAALGYGLLRPRVFASEAVLKVSAIDINPAAGGDASLIGDISAVAPFPVLDINSYTQQIVNNRVLEGTVSALDMTDAQGAPVKAEDLKRRITVTADEKTQLLRVTATGDTPQAAADLANMLGEQLRLYLAETIGESCDETYENISRRLEAQRERVDAATEELRAYSEGPNNARALESASESLLAQMSRYKTDLNDMERALQADRMALSGLRDAGAGVSAGQLKINLSSEGTASSRYAGAGGEEKASAVRSAPMEITVEPGTDVENVLLSVKKAELEARLIQNDAEYNALLSMLAVMEEELTQMTGALAEERKQYDILQRDYQLAGAIYGQYQRIYRQIPVIASSDLARRSIQTLSPGMVPDRPETPGVLLCAGVGAVLGLFAGVFGVLFAGYWTRTDEAPGVASV